MKRFILSAGVGLVSGVILFFLSVAFLCFVLLVFRSMSHSMPDMSLAYKAAIPVAILGAIAGFFLTLIKPNWLRFAR
jgi:uncharacterized membrane protein YqhA